MLIRHRLDVPSDLQGDQIQEFVTHVTSDAADRGLPDSEISYEVVEGEDETDQRLLATYWTGTDD